MVLNIQSTISYFLYYICTYRFYQFQVEKKINCYTINLSADVIDRLVWWFQYVLHLCMHMCAFFRCLLYEGAPLAEFLGIHHTDAQTPSYIYDGHLVTLHRYLHNSQTNTACQIPLVLSELVCGLAYLHTKGLVHMEISTDTVTVSGHISIQII